MPAGAGGGQHTSQRETVTVGGARCLRDVWTQGGEEEFKTQLVIMSPQNQLQTKSTESSEAELALHAEVRGVRSELDEAKRKVSRLSQEIRELNSRLEASEREKEALKESVGQLEEAKRQQERALEKINKEVADSFPLITLPAAAAPLLKGSTDTKITHRFRVFSFCSSCSLLAERVSVCVLEGGGAGSPGSDGGAEREGAQGCTGSATPWQRCSA